MNRYIFIALSFLAVAGCESGVSSSAPAASEIVAAERTPFLGTWGGALPNGNTIEIRVPAQGEPSYFYRGNRVAVRSARMRGEAMVLTIGDRYPATITLTPSGNGLAYLYDDGEDRASAMLVKA